jgi:hypothetical protein
VARKLTSSVCCQQSGDTRVRRSDGTERDPSMEGNGYNTRSSDVATATCFFCCCCCKRQERQAKRPIADLCESWMNKHSIPPRLHDGTEELIERLCHPEVRVRGSSKKLHHRRGQTRRQKPASGRVRTATNSWELASNCRNSKSNPVAQILRKSQSVIPVEV